METEIIVALIASVTAIFISVFNSTKTSRKSAEILKKQRIQIKYDILNEKRKYILKKLTEFYYPMKTYLESSKTEYDTFIEDKPTGFRTLILLLKRNENEDDYKLSKNDENTLEQIFKIGSDIEKLIVEKSGLIDDSEFIDTYTPSDEFSNYDYPKGRSLLGITRSHISTIKKAFNKKLTGETEKFKKHVFPKELNVRVDDKIKELEESNEEIEKEMEVLTSEIEK